MDMNHGPGAALKLFLAVYAEMHWIAPLLGSAAVVKLVSSLTVSFKIGLFLRAARRIGDVLICAVQFSD